MDSGAGPALHRRVDRDRDHQAGVSPGPFTAIVVGIDGSEMARSALRSAIELACRTQAGLYIVSVYEPVSEPRVGAGTAEAEPIEPDAQWSLGARAEVLSLLAAADHEARQAGLAHVETFARQGDAADAILDVAEEQRADLIVVGNKGMTGARRFLLGSVPNKVSHHAPCSVLIVRTS
jgi:nucleotide-binding universal stress UspA family protein